MAPGWLCCEITLSLQRRAGREDKTLWARCATASPTLYLVFPSVIVLSFPVTEAAGKLVSLPSLQRQGHSSGRSSLEGTGGSAGAVGGQGWTLVPSHGQPRGRCPPLLPRAGIPDGLHSPRHLWDRPTLPSLLWSVHWDVDEPPSWASLDTPPPPRRVLEWGYGLVPQASDPDLAICSALTLCLRMAVASLFWVSSPGEGALG